MDYQGNSKKDRERQTESTKKEIKKVTTGEVLIHKKTVSDKLFEFLEIGLKSAWAYAVHDVVIPGLVKLTVEGFQGGVERMFYRDGSRGRYRVSEPGNQRITYSTPVRRMGYYGDPREDIGRRSLPQPQRPSYSRTTLDDIVLSSEHECNAVIEQMTDIADQYQVVTVREFKEMLGIKSIPPDEIWGWELADVARAQVHQVREGYLLDLPQPKEIR